MPGPPLHPPREQITWWDQQAASYADWMLWIHLCCCSCPGLIIGLLFVIFCKTSAGKQKGTQLIIFSSIGIGIGIVLNVIASVLQVGQQGGIGP
jgi:hypothetical protein